jgi:flagellar hook-basal body complex protein FliE
MTTAAIGPLTAIGPIAGIAPSVGALDNATQSNGASFGRQLANGLDNLQRAQSNADDLAVSAATGDLTDVHDYMIASTKAQLATQLTVAVRNKAVDAFNEIMRMQA